MILHFDSQDALGILRLARLIAFLNPSSIPQPANVTELSSAQQEKSTKASCNLGETFLPMKDIVWQSTATRHRQGELLHQIAVSAFNGFARFSHNQKTAMGNEKLSDF